MSDHDDDGTGNTNTGRRRTQWKKGQTGNPKGRPRKVRAPVEAASTDILKLISVEANRVVTLSEGGKPVSMSALQAALRATSVSAIKGNALAQKTYIQLALASELQLSKLRREEQTNAILTKIDLEEERRVWMVRGYDENDMPRHPADVVIDPLTGNVVSYLLFTNEALQERRRMIEFRDHLLGLWPQMLAVRDEDGDDVFLECARLRASNAIDFMNEKLAPRFRRYLPGREPDLLARSTPAELWRALSCERGKAGG